jgi:hypothetical protein
MEDQAEMIYERFENGELTIDEALRAMFQLVLGN